MYLRIESRDMVQLTLNEPYIERICEMSSWQFFNVFYTFLRKFQYLRK